MKLKTAKPKKMTQREMNASQIIFEFIYKESLKVLSKSEQSLIKDMIKAIEHQVAVYNSFIEKGIEIFQLEIMIENDNKALNKYVSDALNEVSFKELKDRKKVKELSKLDLYGA